MENYESLGRIGEGTYAVVHKARDRKSGTVVAIKKFKDSDADEQVKKIALREVRILRALHHGNIVRLLAAFRRKGRLHLVFEYIDHTLLELLEANPRGLPPPLVKTFMWQLLGAVDYLHKHKLIHRDVKPENVLVGEGDVKLCDFGFARPLLDQGARYSEYVATRWYRAPELLVGDRQYGPGVDIWAVGCLFAELCTGQPLFPGDSDVDQLWLVTKAVGHLGEHLAQCKARNQMFKGTRELGPGDMQPLDRRRLPQMDELALQLLKASLHPDPRHRPSAEALMQLPYFAEYHHLLRQPRASATSFLDDPNAAHKRRRVTLQDNGDTGSATGSPTGPLSGPFAGDGRELRFSLSDNSVHSADVSAATTVQDPEVNKRASRASGMSSKPTIADLHDAKRITAEFEANRKAAIEKEVEAISQQHAAEKAQLRTAYSSSSAAHTGNRVSQANEDGDVRHNSTWTIAAVTGNRQSHGAPSGAPEGAPQGPASPALAPVSPRMSPGHSHTREQFSLTPPAQSTPQHLPSIAEQNTQRSGFGYSKAANPSVSPDPIQPAQQQHVQQQHAGSNHATHTYAVTGQGHAPQAGTSYGSHTMPHPLSVNGGSETRLAPIQTAPDARLAPVHGNHKAPPAQHVPHRLSNEGSLQTDRRTSLAGTLPDIRQSHEGGGAWRMGSRIPQLQPETPTTHPLNTTARLAPLPVVHHAGQGPHTGPLGGSHSPGPSSRPPVHQQGPQQRLQPLAGVPQGPRDTGHLQQESYGALGALRQQSVQSTVLSHMAEDASGSLQYSLGGITRSNAGPSGNHAHLRSVTTESSGGYPGAMLLNAHGGPQPNLPPSASDTNLHMLTAGIPENVALQQPHYGQTRQPQHGQAYSTTGMTTWANANRDAPGLPGLLVRGSGRSMDGGMITHGALPDAAEMLAGLSGVGGSGQHRHRHTVTGSKAPHGGSPGAPRAPLPPPQRKQGRGSFTGYGGAQQGAPKSPTGSSSPPGSNRTSRFGSLLPTLMPWGHSGAHTGAHTGAHAGLHNGGAHHHHHAQHHLIAPRGGVHHEMPQPRHHDHRQSHQGGGLPGLDMNPLQIHALKPGR